jgi:hypothetical protein
MTERLTPGEMAIYAAVFAAEVAPLFKPGGVPLYVIKDGTENDWRAKQAVSAAEIAWATVEAFRAAAIGILQGFGSGDVLDMHMNMRGY